MKKNYVWLTCAVILSLSAAVPAWPQSSFTDAQTDVLVGNGNSTDSPCSPHCLTPISASSLLSNSGGTGNASASAGFGALDASASIASSSGSGGAADAATDFKDSFSVLSGSSDPGTFQITFVTTGFAVTTNGSASADVFLTMKVGNGSFLGALSSSYGEFVSPSGTTNIGLPTTVFNIDASDGDTIVIFASLDAQANASNGDAASAVDPVSVFITAPAGFTFTSASGTVYPSTPSSTPEPNSLLLLSSGLACLGTWGRKFFKRA